MQNNALILLWLLFGLPPLIFGLVLLGAHIYCKGMQQQTPTPSLPKFTSSANGEDAKAQARLPRV